MSIEQHRDRSLAIDPGTRNYGGVDVIGVDHADTPNGGSGIG